MSTFMNRMKGGTSAAVTLVMCGALLGACVDSVEPVAYENSHREALLNPKPEIRMPEAVRDRYARARAAYAGGNYEVAKARFVALAADGYPDAAYELGKMYKFGIGVEKDRAIAATWLLPAVERHNSHRAEAAFHLGELFARGEGVPKDPELALALLEMAQREEVAAAGTPLARMYATGDGVERDLSKAERLAQEAAAADVIDAHFWLMNAYAPDGVLRSDPQLMEQHADALIPLLEERASVYPNDPEAMRKLAEIYRYGLGRERNVETALDWYWRIAAVGEPRYLVNYAEKLIKGRDATPEEMTIAANVLRSAAPAFESSEAKLLLGEAYLLGRGVPRNQARGEDWVRIAAESGFPRAQLHYGRILLRDAPDDRARRQAVAMYRQAHEGGNAHATAELGELHLNGGIPDANPSEGAELLAQAFRGGADSAAGVLGRAYLDGKGVAPDPRLAKLWLERASVAGDEDSRLVLANAVMEGRLEGDPQQAAETVKVFAEEGDRFAMMELARAYRDGTGESGGDGLAPDHAKAQRWFRRAQEAGVEEAGPSLASMLYFDAREPDGNVDIATAREAAEMGHAGSLAVVGRAYLEGEGVPRNEEKGIRMLRRAASKGNAGAKATMGEILLEGEYGLAEKPRKARQLLRSAAADGNEFAQRELGEALLTGDGLAQDKDRGLALLKRSADQGDLHAMRILGRAYLEGDGVAPDDGTAVRYLAEAASRGDDGAQMLLGRAYAYGTDGLDQDVGQGLALLEEGASQGHTGSMAALGRIYLSDQLGQKDAERGATLLYQAARNGHPTARRALAKAYLKSRGVEHANAAYANVWLRNVLEGDSDLAIQTLTQMLQEDRS